VGNNGVSRWDLLGLEVTQDATIGFSKLMENVRKWEAEIDKDNPNATCEEKLEKFRDYIHYNSQFGSGGSFSGDPNFGPSNKGQLGWHYLHTSEGWIDFGHFSNAAHFEQSFGESLTKIGGHLVEAGQALSTFIPGYSTATKTSAATREDYKSNRLGAEFSSYLDDCDCESLADELETFLKKYNPSEAPEDAADYNDLPATQDDLDTRGYFSNIGNATKNVFTNGFSGFYGTVFSSSNPSK